jgi:hypothetical protein
MRNLPDPFLNRQWRSQAVLRLRHHQDLAVVRQLLPDTENPYRLNLVGAIRHLLCRR